MAGTGGGDPYSSIPLAGVNIVGDLVNGYLQYKASKEQNKILKEGQEQSFALAQEQARTSKRQFAEQMQIAKQGAAEQVRQFSVQAGMQQDDRNYSRFQDQANRLSNLMASNEQLKNLFLNRIASLKRG